MIWWALATDAATLKDRSPSTSVDTQPGASRNRSTPTEAASRLAVAAATRRRSALVPTVRKSCDGKRTSLFARAFAGGDVVSFNLYRLRSGKDSLRPCEVSAKKVVAFVLGYFPDPPWV